MAADFFDYIAGARRRPAAQRLAPYRFNHPNTEIVEIASLFEGETVAVLIRHGRDLDGDAGSCRPGDIVLHSRRFTGY